MRGRRLGNGDNSRQLGHAGAAAQGVEGGNLGIGQCSIVDEESGRGVDSGGIVPRTVGNAADGEIRNIGKAGKCVVGYLCRLNAVHILGKTMIRDGVGDHQIIECVHGRRLTVTFACRPPFIAGCNIAEGVIGTTPPELSNEEVIAGSSMSSGVSAGTAIQSEKITETRNFEPTLSEETLNHGKVAVRVP